MTQVGRRGLVEWLQTSEILIADGATGTNYQHMGLQAGQRPEEWLFDEPDKVKALHRRFIEAGADIILANSFGGTRLRLKDTKYSEMVTELNQRAAQLAHEAATEANRDILVAGSMGPTGHLLYPLGRLTRQEAVDNYAEQAAALARGGVDFLLAETMFDLAEAQAALKGSHKATALPVVCSFSFDQGTRTMMGIRPREVVRGLESFELAALGFNCGRRLEEAIEVLTEMSQAVEGRLPLWCKPNAGLPRPEAGRLEYDVTPVQMGQWTVDFLKLGARIVGGCCGTTPEHLAAIADSARRYIAEGAPG